MGFGAGTHNRSARAFVAITLAAGMGSLILFYVFMFLGSFTAIDFHLNTPQAIILDTLLCLLFVFQHSIMIRQGARRRLAALVPEPYYNTVYALVSGIVLTTMLLFWQKSPDTIGTAGTILHWTLRVLFSLGLAGFYWAVKSLGAFDPFGVKQLKRHLDRKAPKDMPLAVKGAYRWMRHPLYTSSLIAIWAVPHLTTDRLLLNIILTVWIVTGTMLEERDLVREFGQPYRDYKARVPMLIPYKQPGHVS